MYDCHVQWKDRSEKKGYAGTHKCDKIMKMCSRSDLQYIYMYEQHVLWKDTGEKKGLCTSVERSWVCAVGL